MTIRSVFQNTVTYATLQAFSSVITCHDITPLQYVVVFLIVTVVVWLSDVVIRYCYHKLRQLCAPSQTPAVQFHRGHGEESVSLLDETATAEGNENANNYDNHDVLSNELLEQDQL